VLKHALLEWSHLQCKLQLPGVVESSHAHWRVDKHNCTSTPLQDLFNDYNCTCASGFIGLYCGTEVDECLPGPCENNGTCEDEVNGYSCTCEAEFTVTTYILVCCSFELGIEFTLFVSCTTNGIFSLLTCRESTVR